ncbi:MAG TPA: class I SAM-dependent methyltransferase [bacterium]|nr:class I SAM-dependent methyltransferase [bacterium]HPN45910.1 class I SAM-dependent methyltransferase [bacterium]
MESSLEKSILESLDGRNDELLPFIPYLLQDMWELGSLPQDIIKLIRKHRLPLDHTGKILDLGCGKGAVSITLAQEFGCRVLGIDGVPDFITAAQHQARLHKVEELCTFQSGDMRELVCTLVNFDLALLGSIGPVFGDLETTINSVVPCLKNNGYLLIDDGYLKEDSQIQKQGYCKRGEILQQIDRCPVRIIDEYYINDTALGDLSDVMYAQIKNRVAELIAKYPQQRHLFESYLQTQEEEFAVLENDMQGVTWLLQYRQ